MPTVMVSGSKSAQAGLRSMSFVPAARLMPLRPVEPILSFDPQEVGTEIALKPRYTKIPTSLPRFWEASQAQYMIASGREGFATAAGFASNGYGAHSPGGYSLLACLVAEVVLTFFSLLVIMGSTDRRAPVGFAPIGIGFALTLIHLISIPVTNTSVNPARRHGLPLSELRLQRAERVEHGSFGMLQFWQGE